MIEQDLALGLSRMGRAYSPLATLDGTGATCVEVGMRGRKNKAEDVWGSVDVRSPDECWLWTGAKGAYGRGVVRWSGKHMNAARAIWIITAQIEPPKHLYVCHTCNNPTCCNPSHLYVGTAKDNARDAVVSGRHSALSKATCKRGHPFEGANVKTLTRRNGERVCVACTRIRSVRQYRKKYPNYKGEAV